jgi:polyhydroxybutyrate depolymerase
LKICLQFTTILIALGLFAACAPPAPTAAPAPVVAPTIAPSATRESRPAETRAALSVPTNASVAEATKPLAVAPTNAPAAIASATTAPAAPIVPKPGEYENSIVVGGETRDYILHIPAGYNGAKLMPLVLMLHGHGASAQETEKNTDWSAKADKENFIVAYPNGTGNPRAWDAIFFPVPPPQVDDVAFVRALIDLFEKNLRLDSKRIYVSGFSNGAMMTYLLGAELSDRLAAIAIAEGTIGAKQADGSTLMIPNPSQPLPVIAFHGKQDDVVPYDGGARTEHVQFLSVADSIGFWVKQDGCNGTPATRTSQNGNVIETDYVQCEGNSEVTLYTIGNGKHDWPSATMRDQISATDTVWDFFARHPKP